jgi:hypothetical protein
VLAVKLEYNTSTPGHRPLATQDEIMTIMTQTKHKVRSSHRDGRAGVYRSKAARNPDPLWRDIVAGAVFFTMLCIGVGVILVGGLIVFG